jgi:hypothetical protein
MSVTVPDHNTLVAHIQGLVISAVGRIGWTEAAETCPAYDVSITLVRTVYLWDPKDHKSFNFQKLLNVYDWAYDVREGLRAKPAQLRR